METDLIEEVPQRSTHGISTADAASIKRSLLKVAEDQCPSERDIVEVARGLVEAFQILDDEAFIQSEMEALERKKHEELTAVAK